MEGNKKAYRQNVELTNEEHKKLVDELGDVMVAACLDELAEWKITNPSQAKKHKNDYLRIRKWVITAVKERLIREKRVEQAEKNQANPSKSAKENREESNYQKAAKHFRHGQFYNGAECYLNSEGVAFCRGMVHKQVKFSEWGFDDQFNNLLRTFGIQV